MAAHQAAPTRAVAALLFNAAVWGLSWWPMRQLASLGWHPLWATVLIFALAVLAVSLRRARVWRELARSRALWAIVAAAGGTNAFFNWGVTTGDVVRVVLMFYVMPLWTVLLARWWLHEPITPASLVRVALALAGAATVLWPTGAQGGAALAAGLPELLGLAGGLCFAINNVLLRRHAACSPEGRASAMFLGGVLMSLALVGLLQVPPPAPGGTALAAVPLAGAALLALVFLASNWALQWGTAHLPASVAAVVMVTEVIWAAGSSLALGAGQFSGRVLLGTVLILAAALLAAWPGQGSDNAGQS